MYLFIIETAMGVKIKAQTEDSKYVKTVGKYNYKLYITILHSFNQHFKYCRSGKLAAKLNFSPWQFFPKWMYHFFSSEGREWCQLTTFLNDFGKQVVSYLYFFFKSINLSIFFHQVLDYSRKEERNGNGRFF